MESVQATPKYDLVKKRFMSATLNEESISLLLKALSKLGHSAGGRSISSLSLAANSRKEFDGYLTTIEFLENCMHSQKSTQNGLEGSEVEPEALLLNEETTHRSRQKSIDWNEAKDAANMFCSKATALSKRNTIAIHVIVSNQENNLRRLKWLLKMRFFAEIGKVDKVVVVPSRAELSGLAFAGDILQTGFAFVVFESETIADKALAAAQHFPWPVRGRFNQETNSFERIRYHRCQMQTLCDLEDTLAHVPGENLTSSASVTRDYLLSTADLLAVELRALQNSLQDVGGGKDSAKLVERESLVHAIGNDVTDKIGKPVEDQATLSKDKKYSPGTKSKIAALLRKSIQEVRLASHPQADSPARNFAPTLSIGAGVVKKETSSPCGKSFSLDSTEKLLLKIQNVMESMNVDPPSSASATTKKALQHSEIGKHLRVSARTGDLYEVIGWYQEKIKLLQIKTSGGASEGSGPGRTNSVSWFTFQPFLDGLKTEVRTDRELAKESKTILQTDKPDCARVMCALDALALLLLAEQMNQERSATDALKSTIHTQREIIEQNEQRAEGLSERLTDVRERVREYSHEIAELEQENRILSESAARYDVVRDQLFEAESLLVEYDQRLANRDNELRAAHASNVLLRQTVEDLRRENARLLHTQQHHSQHTPHAPAAASAHTRTSSHSHRNNFHNHVLSDSDSEQESKAKASHSEHRNQRVSAASGRISTQAESHSKAEPVASLSAQVTQLACTTTSDWIQLYLTRSSTLEEVQATETELAGIKGDLTAILSKFDVARKELIVCFHAKRGQLMQREKDKKATEMADQNLCCICLEHPKSVLLMPCRHLCVCQVCSEGGPESPLRASRPRQEKRVKSIKSCPVCRAAVDECLKVFS